MIDINMRFAVDDELGSRGRVGFELLTGRGRRWFGKLLKRSGATGSTVWIDTHDPAAQRIYDLMVAEGTAVEG